MTGERIRARKGDLAIYGKLTNAGVELQVRPQSNSLDAEAPFDFKPILDQLDRGETVNLVVGPYRLINLLDSLAQAGWRARLTGDRLTGERGLQKLDGTLEGSKAILKYWTPTR